MGQIDRGGTGEMPPFPSDALRELESKDYDQRKKKRRESLTRKGRRKSHNDMKSS